MESVIHMLKKSHGKKKKFIIIAASATAVAILLSAFFIYVGDYYRASPEVADYPKKNDRINITEIDEGLFIDGAGEENALVFYPGAKIEYTSYLPLVCLLAENGIDVFLVKMPFNLAFFGINKADKIIEDYRYEHWYLGGHSLGGAMAADYAAKHGNGIDGLVLLAAYTASDLKESDLDVLTVYGSNDGVLNMEKIEQGRELVPENSVETVIDGGNHAYFGLYGEQKGDNAATISHEEQWRQTADAIVKMLKTAK